MSVRRSPHMNVMVDAAEKAGRSLIRDFGEVEHLQVSRKGPNDFVSNADRKAEAVLREILQKARPNYPLLLEESGTVDGSDAEHRFIADPLDGTTNFLHGLPHWSVSIALERAGEIIAGVVYDPIKDEMFWAEKGLGAMMNNRRIQVSGRKNLTDALVSTFPGEKAAASTRALLQQGADLRCFGSACLDLCYVAAGRFDAYYEHGLAPWDKAAGVLIVKEARGIVSDISGGKDTVYGNGVIAANAALHGPILAALGAGSKSAVAQ